MPAPSGQSCAVCQYVVMTRSYYAGQMRDYYSCHESPLTSENAWRDVAPTDWCGKWLAAGTLPPPPPPLLPVVSGVAPAPAGTASSSAVMMGLGSIAGFSITPMRTGRIVAMLTGCCANSGANGGLSITGRHGTGTAPNNGDAASGALWSTTQDYYMTSARDVSGFTVIGGNPGLALNVPVWFDVAIAATGGGTATISDVQCLLFEL